MTNNLVKKIAQGTALFTGLVVGAISFGGCKGAATAIYRDSPIGEVHFALKEAGAPKVYINNQEQQQGMSDEDRIVLNQIKSTPRIVCRGDVDNDGYLEWHYYDGKGWIYPALGVFKNDKGLGSLKPSKEYYKQGMWVYYPGGGKPGISLPKDILIIWPQKYKESEK